jgi:hypothetical protein
VILVESKLVPDPQANKQRYGHACGQTTNVDECITFVFNQITKGDFEVAAKHRRDGFGNTL